MNWHRGYYYFVNDIHFSMKGISNWHSNGRLGHKFKPGCNVLNQSRFHGPGIHPRVILLSQDRAKKIFLSDPYTRGNYDPESYTDLPRNTQQARGPAGTSSLHHVSELKKCSSFAVYQPQTTLAEILQQVWAMPPSWPAHKLRLREREEGMD